MILEEAVSQQLKRHEGYSTTLYLDTVGKQTIGYGRNISDVGISKDEAEYMLANDIKRTIKDVRILFTNFDSLSVNRQSVLVNMMFNLGMTKLSQFSNMNNAIKNGDFAAVSAQMLDSKWAKQVGNRAIELAQLMKNG